MIYLSNKYFNILKKILIIFFTTLVIRSLILYVLPLETFSYVYYGLIALFTAIQLEFLPHCIYMDTGSEISTKPFDLKNSRGLKMESYKGSVPSPSLRPVTDNNPTIGANSPIVEENNTKTRVNNRKPRRVLSPVRKVKDQLPIIIREAHVYTFVVPETYFIEPYVKITVTQYIDAVTGNIHVSDSLNNEAVYPNPFTKSLRTPRHEVKIPPTFDYRRYPLYPSHVGPVKDNYTLTWDHPTVIAENSMASIKNTRGNTRINDPPS